ncbi:MAG: AAA family ATPase, partial [Chloroflexota bacterium]
MTRLKQLHIHGFKSFANPTTFVFDDGITAIIGPNGSGKSNVAEALRWALGEQQYSALRGRRTEDIIFAGSDRRGQMGMAEVSLVIDNSDGGLPIAFSEVTITRRAHRSGENQYLINGSKVRLRDVQQVTAPLGQTHTIIGQGLVDAVLSQRPDDRRGLFEHAAGITGLRLQATTAERSLGEAEDNAQRLRDILAELEPRVRSLARSAKQAREYSTVRDELQQLQRAYYGALWRDGLAKQRASRDALKKADEALERVEIEHTTASRALAKLRAEQRDLQEKREQTDREIAARERELADVRHRIDLLDAEKRAAEGRIADLKSLIAGLESQVTSIERAHLDAEATQQELQQELCGLREKLAELESRGQATRERRHAVETRLGEIDRRLLELTREQVALDGRHRSAQDRLQQLLDERSDLEADRRELNETIATVESAIAERQGEIDELARNRDDIERSESTTQGDLQRARAIVSETVGSIDAAQRELDRMRERLAVLERGYEDGEGLYAGVRSLVRAVRRGERDVPGLIGTVAESIEVPPEFEQAIEVALGGHLQDLIVRTWKDAETGIAFLKERNAGRATFQPLDAVRSSGRRPQAPEEPGIIGVAADLISYDKETAAVIEFLLGRTLIVEDLQVSRRVLDTSRGWTVVTLDGDITRPYGSVTGGSRSRAAGLLERERERRNLPAEIERKRTSLLEQNEQLEAKRSTVGALEQKLDELRAQGEQIDRQRSRLEREQRDAERDLDRLLERRERSESRLAQVDTTLDA